MSKISLFIPVYNGEKYLHKTISNILSSSFSDFEILFVDDGSTDTSAEILKQASLKDSRIKVFTKKNEGSVPFGWNYIFEYINSPWTLYMSQDDLIHPELLVNLIKTQKRTNADCVIPSCVFFSDEGKTDYQELNRLNDMTARSKQCVISGREAFELMFDYEIPGFALWRSDMIKEIGMPTEAFNSDEGMQRIWVLNCNKVAFEPTPFYYRQQSNSIGATFKLHQFYSVKTEKRLLQAARQEHISDIKIRKAQYKSLFWTLWLYSYLKINKNKYQNEYGSIKMTLDDAYSFFRYQLPQAVCLKDYIVYLASVCSFFKNIYIQVYSLYLKKKLGKD